MPANTEEIRAFFNEQLPAERMAELEEELRNDESLRLQFAAVARQHDPGDHSVGAIWRRRRLSCPSRSELGSFLLEALDAVTADYIDFHLRVIGCRYCAANLEDLREASVVAADPVAAEQRRRKFFQSSAGHLSSDPPTAD